MNNFKEWLSDNLRYFMLGFFVILILVLAFFGIRFVSAKIADKPQEVPVTQGTSEVTEEPKQEDESEGVATPTPAEELDSDNQLEKNAHPQVNAIIQSYYRALGEKDINGIKDVVDELDPAEEAKITKDQNMDGYSNVVVYTKDGLSEGEYVVFASYNYKFKGVEALVPGLSQLYVRTREDGTLYISMQEDDEKTQQHVTKTMQDADVEALIQEVKEEYAKAQEDEELRNFIANLGIASSAAASAEEGSTVTIKGNCNVRATASADGEVIEQLQTGTKVTKTGTEGEWIQISYEGKTGYVRSDLFE